MVETRKPCNVTSAKRGKGRGKCGDSEQSLAWSFKEGNMTDVVKNKGVQIGGIVSLLLIIGWYFISYLSGLAETRDTITAVGYLVYNLLFDFYLLLSLIPGEGIYFLLTASSFQQSTAAAYSVNLSNPWISIMVNGLGIVIGWILQVVMILVVIGIISLAAKSRS